MVRARPLVGYDPLVAGATIAMAASHNRMAGRRNTFAQNIPATESTKAATESPIPNIPTAIPMIETRSGYAVFGSSGPMLVR